MLNCALEHHDAAGKNCLLYLIFGGMYWFCFVDSSFKYHFWQGALVIFFTGCTNILFWWDVPTLFCGFSFQILLQMGCANMFLIRCANNWYFVDSDFTFVFDRIVPFVFFLSWVQKFPNRNNRFAQNQWCSSTPLHCRACSSGYIILWRTNVPAPWQSRARHVRTKQFSVSGPGHQHLKIEGFWPSREHIFLMSEGLIFAPLPACMVVPVAREVASRTSCQTNTNTKQVLFLSWHKHRKCQ